MTIAATNDRQGALDMLADGCRQGRLARVIFPNQGLLQSGKLLNVDEKRLIVQMANADELRSITDDLCCVIFDYQDRPQVFLSAIVEVTGESDRNIALAIPEEIAAAERRHVIRF